MNTQRYKQRLLDLETTLSARIGREADQGRAEFIDSAHDAGDAPECWIRPHRPHARSD